MLSMVAAAILPFVLLLRLGGTAASPAHIEPGIEPHIDRAPSELAAAPLPSGAPRRIVSLNPCLDAILLTVADASQIGALSHYSHDPVQSSVAEQARRFPVIYETAEEILLLEPDLVLASVHSSPATRRALERMNIPVAAFGVPETIAESLAQIREIAALVGRPAAGEALVRRIEQALAELEAEAQPEGAGDPVPALILQPGGFTPGHGTLQDDLLARAGLRNVAERYGVHYWGMVQLEQLVLDPPRLLLSGSTGETALAGGDRLLSHPVLRKLARQREGGMVTSPYPRSLLYCGGPTLIEAARHLRAARAALVQSQLETAP